VEGKAQKSTTFGKLGRTRKTPARDPSFERYDLFVDKCILCRPIERKEMSTPPATFFGNVEGYWNLFGFEDWAFAKVHLV
jgi:hypothetical protein